MVRTAPMVVEAMRPEDAHDISRIAWENGLPLGWSLDERDHGSVARFAGEKRVRAFCMMRETPYGLVIGELWPEKGRAGRKGLALLGAWVERTAQGLVAARKTPLAVGGLVRLDNPAHDAMLAKRGYEIVAYARQKVFTP